MADIHLEHVRRRPPFDRFWMALGLILAALVAWVLLGRGGARQAATGEVVATLPPGGPVTASVVANARDAVGEYVRYTAAHRARTDADHTHEYTAQGIRHLAGAIAALAARDAAGDAVLRAQADTLRARADVLQRDPQATDHARQVSEAFAAAAGLLQTLHDRSGAGTADQLTNLRDAAAAVDPDRLLLRQKPEVQQFFDRASAAVQGMLPPATS
jgi:hypothetical protein